MPSLTFTFLVHAKGKLARRRIAELPHLADDPRFWNTKRVKAAAAFLRAVLGMPKRTGWELRNLPDREGQRRG